MPVEMSINIGSIGRESVNLRHSEKVLEISIIT